MMRQPGLRFLLAVLVGALVLSPWMPVAFPAIARFWPSTFAPWGPVVAGSSVIVAHALLAARMRDERSNGESLDANYFLGFVFTLLYLLFGLWSVHGTGITDAWVTSFLADLGVGLTFTVVGLVMRQVSVLQSRSGALPDAGSVAVAPAAEPTPAERNTVELAEAARNLLSVAQTMQNTIGNLATPQQERAAQRVGEVTATFERTVGDATTRLARAMDEFSTRSVMMHTELAGSWSSARSALQSHAEAIEQQTAVVVERLTLARSELQHLLLETSRDATATQKMVAVTARTQLVEWETQLRTMHESMLAIRTLAEQECQAAYEALAESTKAFNSLAHDVAERTRNLPDPSAQLASVWTNISEQETRMVSAMTRVAAGLEAVSQQSAVVTSQFASLEEQARSSGTTLVQGVSDVRDGLVEQNRVLSDLVGEVVDVIEGRVNALAR